MQNPLKLLWLVVPFIAFGVGFHWYRDAWIALPLYHALIIVALLVHRREWHISDGWRGFNWGWAAFLLIGILPLIFGLIHLGEAKGFGGEKLARGLAHFGLTESTLLPFVIYLCAINPVLEELFWRKLLARTTRWPTLEDLAFGVFHYLILILLLPPLYAFAGVLGLIAIGWLWRQLAVKYGGLSLAILDHFAGDLGFCIIVAVLIAG